MSAIPGLKKKLKSILATGKLSKAMKTVAAVKLSRLSETTRWSALVVEEYRRLMPNGGEYAPDAAGEENRPETAVVFGSERGFCGGFDRELLIFFMDWAAKNGLPPHLLVCGAEIARLLEAEGFVPERVFSLGETPAIGDCEPLFETLEALRAGRTDYPVTLIRPLYKNTLTQIPTATVVPLEPTRCAPEIRDGLWVPAMPTVMTAVGRAWTRAVLYNALQETALGAQAATLVTMRSAYDTSEEYRETLLGEIHRLRQSEVTADVIETASERSKKGEKADG